MVRTRVRFGTMTMLSVSSSRTPGKANFLSSEGERLTKTIDHTAENAYMGQAGFYILHDDEEEAVAGLPQGDYDIPLGLTSKRYNPDGSLWSPEVSTTDFRRYRRL